MNIRLYRQEKSCRFFYVYMPKRMANAAVLFAKLFIYNYLDAFCPFFRNSLK